jgi:hypothetical protein
VGIIGARILPFTMGVGGGQEKTLAGLIDSQASLSAALGVTKNLAGSIDAQATLSVARIIDSVLAGSIDADASMTVPRIIDSRLTGLIDAQASLSAALGVTKNLAGLIRGNADMAARLVDSLLGGSIDADASMSGTMAAGGPANLVDAILATQAANLQGFWKFDEASGNILDYSGNDRTLTAANLTYAQTGQVGDACAFNGTSSNAVIASTGVLGATVPSAWTVHVLSNRNAGSFPNRRMFSVTNSADSDPSITFGSATLNAADVRLFVALDNGTVERDASTATDLVTAGEWFQFIVRRGADGNFTVFRDGVKVIDVNDTQGTITIDRFYVGSVKFGAGADGAFFPGRMQHVAAWSTGLSDAEVATLFSFTGL